MDKELRILILEDNPADAALEEYELREAGLVFTLKVVGTKEAFLKALEEFSSNIILSDYDLPSLDGLEALRIVKEKCPDVPFILVTGKIGEEFAIEKLKEGATDYVLKGNLKRLVPSVKRALEEAKLIKEQTQAVKALKQSEERYRKQFEEAIDAIFLADSENGMIVDCNFAASKLLEREKSEIIGKHQTFLHPAKDIKDGFSKTFKSHMVVEPSELLEDRVITKSGQMKDVAIRASKITLEGKEVMQGIFRDITKRKRADQQLREAKEFAESITNSLPGTFYIVDKNGQILQWNKNLETVSEYSAEEIGKMNALDFVAEEDKNLVMSRIQEVFVKGQSLVESHFLTKSKRKIPYLFTGLRFVSGDQTYLVGMGIDITERRRAEDALKAREKELDLKNKNLEEINTALNVLLKKRDEDKTELEEKVLSNIQQLVEPYILKLKQSGLDERQKTLAVILESNLKDITSSFTYSLSSRYLNLTPSEVKITNLIMKDKTSKEICQILGSSEKMVAFHRLNIRRKLGLQNKKINLKSFLTAKALK